MYAIIFPFGHHSGPNPQRASRLAARPVRVHDPYAAGIITGEGDPLAVRGPTGHGSGSEILQSLAVGPAREHVRHRPAFPEDRATGIEGDFAPRQETIRATRARCTPGESQGAGNCRRRRPGRAARANRHMHG